MYISKAGQLKSNLSVRGYRVRGSPLEMRMNDNERALGVTYYSRLTGKLASPWKKPVGFWTNAINKLCGKHKFITLTCFVHRDNQHHLNHF